MDDMGIGEIVSQVLFGPNFLERFPAWQVSSLKKKFLIFFVCPINEIGRSNPWQNPYIISNTFFSMKKWKISKSVCDGTISGLVTVQSCFGRSCGGLPEFNRKKIFILKTFQIKLLWWWRPLKSWSSSSLSDSSPKEWNYQHMVMKHIR